MVSFPRGKGHLLVSCAPMREQKTTRKVLFELGSAQRCHHWKNAILVGKVCVFTNFTRGCRSKRVDLGFLIYCISCGHTGLTDEKRIKNHFIRSCPVVFVLCPFLIG